MAERVLVAEHTCCTTHRLKPRERLTGVIGDVIDDVRCEELVETRSKAARVDGRFRCVPAQQ
jgi:hypothetical protein